MNTNACYIFNKKSLIDNYNYINNSFKKYFNNFIIGYSFKTNPLSCIINCVKEMGSYAEVVSDYEYNMALSYGFNPCNIIYNGVCKSPSSIEHCLKNGGIINLDNYNDVECAVNFAKTNNTKACVGIRVNFDVGNGIKSRFGFTEKDFYDLLNNEYLNVTGLHCHFSHAKEKESWVIRAKKMCELSKSIKDLRYLDFGSGMYALTQKNLMNDYAQIIFNELNVCYKDKMPCIIIESGTPLVHECLSVECNILFIKDGFIFTDASIFDLGAHASGDKCQIKIIKNSSVNESERKYLNGYKISGYTCMEHDILKKSFSGYAAPGDKIQFLNIGEYSYAWSNNFINPPLNVVIK